MTPKQNGFYAPAEWSHHDAIWVAWPSHEDLWQDGLRAAQESFTELLRAVASAGDDAAHLHVCVADSSADEGCSRALVDVFHTRHKEAFGDIWLRDTAPIFLRNASGERASAVFRFNGWGGKYVLPGDDTLAGRVADRAGFRRFELPWVLEGGSVEYDGEGTVLTTRQCLLNANRNPSKSSAEIEAAVHLALGTEKALWVTGGLLNDHTDGHIDTIARLVAPGVAVCMEPASTSDPNHDVLLAIRRELEAMTDARGRRLQVHVVPSPGLVADGDGEPMPASHVNYLVTNGVVVVPLYETRHDDAALKAFESLFPGRRVVGVQARAILAGGGAFHCITQQVPSSRP